MFYPGLRKTVFSFSIIQAAILISLISCGPKGDDKKSESKSKTTEDIQAQIKAAYEKTNKKISEELNKTKDDPKKAGGPGRVTIMGAGLVNKKDNEVLNSKIKTKIELGKNQKIENLQDKTVVEPQLVEKLTDEDLKELEMLASAGTYINIGCKQIESNLTEGLKEIKIEEAKKETAKIQKLLNDGRVKKTKKPKKDGDSNGSTKSDKKDKSEEKVTPAPEEVPTESETVKLPDPTSLVVKVTRAFVCNNEASTKVISIRAEHIVMMDYKQTILGNGFVEFVSKKLSLKGQNFVTVTAEDSDSDKEIKSAANVTIAVSESADGDGVLEINSVGGEQKEEAANTEPKVPNPAENIPPIKIEVKGEVKGTPPTPPKPK